MQALALLALLAAGSAPAPAASLPVVPAHVGFHHVTVGPAAGVEIPSAHGARFGVGVDVAVDRLDRLDLGAFEIDLPAGGPPVAGDPASARREMDLTLVGVQAPVSLGRVGPLAVSLVVEAASVDGDFELPAVVRTLGPAGNLLEHATVSYRGEGTVLGAGLETLLASGRSGPFLGAGYRFRTYRGLDLEPEDLPLPPPGGPPEALPAELDRDDHQLTARLGWTGAGGRFAPYVGARAHRTEATVDGRVDLFGQGQTIATRLELESEEVAGLAGLDVRLGGFTGRVEGTFGGDREIVLVKLVRGFGGPSAPRSPIEAVGWPPERYPTEPAEARQERADELAEALAPRVREIRRRFEEGRRRLETVEAPGGPIYAPGQLLALLRTTEADLLAALEARELAPLRAWIEDFFRGLRVELPEATAARAVSSPGERPRPVFASLAAPPRRAAHPAASPQQPGPAGSARARQESVLARVAGFLGGLLTRAEAGELTTDICLRSLPEPGVEVRLFPARYTQRVVADVTERAVRVVYRGLYGYEVGAGRDDGFACPDRPCALDLWVDDGPFVACDLSTEACYLRAGDVEECGR